MDKIKYIAIIAVVVIAVVFIVYYEQIVNYFKIMKLKAGQKEFIKQLNKQAQLLFASFIKEVEQKTGFEVYITSSYRSFAKQAQLHEENPSNSQAGNSFHNYGLAIDINGVKNGEFVLRKLTPREEWISSGIPEIAAKYGLRWGGDFSTYYDPIHFDLGNYYTIAYLKQLATQTYGSNPENIQGNELNLLA